MARSKTENTDLLVHVPRLESLCNPTTTPAYNAMTNVTETPSLPGTTTSSSSCHNRSDGGMAVRRLQSIPSIHNRAKTTNAGTGANNTGNFAEILTGCVIILILLASLIMLVVWRLRLRSVVRQPKLVTYVSTVHSISTDLTSSRTGSVNRKVQQSNGSGSNHGQRPADKMYNLKDSKVQRTSFIDGQKRAPILEAHHTFNNESPPLFIPNSNPTVISVQMNHEVSVLDLDCASVAPRPILLDDKDCCNEKLSAKNNGFIDMNNITKNSLNLSSNGSNNTLTEASVRGAQPSPNLNVQHHCGRNYEVRNQVKITNNFKLNLLNETNSSQNTNFPDREIQPSLNTSTDNTYSLNDDGSTAKNSIQSSSRDSMSMIVQNPNSIANYDWPYRKQHMPVISLSQLSMNVRSCPETPLSPRHCLSNDNIFCDDVTHNCDIMHNCRIINNAPVFVVEYSDAGRCNSGSLLDDSDIFSSESDSQEKDFSRKVSSSFLQHPVEKIGVLDESCNNLTTHL